MGSPYDRIFQRILEKSANCVTLPVRWNMHVTRTTLLAVLVCTMLFICNKAHGDCLLTPNSNYWEAQDLQNQLEMVTTIGCCCYSNQITDETVIDTHETGEGCPAPCEGPNPGSCAYEFEEVVSEVSPTANDEGINMIDPETGEPVCIYAGAEHYIRVHYICIRNSIIYHRYCTEYIIMPFPIFQCKECPLE